MNLLLTILIPLVGAIPFPASPSSTSTTSSCTELTNGKLLCNGPHQFGLCNINNVVQNITWQVVAAGTECQCSSAGVCNVVPTGSGSNSTPTPPQVSSPPSSSPPSASSPPESSPTQPVTPPVPSASPSSAPTTSPNPGNGTYHFYTGDGSTAAGWPSINQWLSFDEIWNGYSKVLGLGCENAFEVPNNTPQDSAEIKQALMSISTTAGVPPSFSLAIMMQESLGCVFVDTTNNGVTNPGLFQSHNGNGTCWHATTCPQSEIEQMVHDGVCGTAFGPGLQQLAEKANCTGAEQWYRAARLYNSGAFGADLANLNAGGGATNCYVMDVANRLTGGFFAGDSPCTAKFG